MRKTSFGLGLAGGILGVLNGIGKLFSGIFMRSLDFNWLNDNDFFPGLSNHSGMMFDRMSELGERFSFFMLPVAFIAIAAGVLGIVGATHVNKNNKSAGIMMLIGGGLCFLTGVGLIATGLMIAGGILALVKPKTDEPNVQ